MEFGCQWEQGSLILLYLESLLVPIQNTGNLSLQLVQQRCFSSNVLSFDIARSAISIRHSYIHILSLLPFNIDQRRGVGVFIALRVRQIDRVLVRITDHCRVRLDRIRW